MIQAADITEIIELAKRGSSPLAMRGNVFNPWADSDPLDAPGEGPDARRLRLLSHFAVHRPKLLLVGEAPGYQGCHFSGVPFTNESLLMSGVIPDLHSGRITTREKPWSEPSATIVWGSLRELGLAGKTVMWNAYPWHPHKFNEPMTNRTPTSAEITDGLYLLDRVIRRFVTDGAVVVAVGKKAEAAISRLGNRDFYRVRHPSMGGANEFRDGMRGIASELGH